MTAVVAAASPNRGIGYQGLLVRYAGSVVLIPCSIYTVDVIEI